MVTKKNPKSWVSTWLTPSLLLGAIVYGGYYAGQFLQKDEDYKESVKNVQFDDSEQKHDVVDLLDIEFHPLKFPFMCSF